MTILCVLAVGCAGGQPFNGESQRESETKRSLSVVSDSWRPHGLKPTRLLRPWDSPGKSAGVGCHYVTANDRQTLGAEGLTTTTSRNKSCQKMVRLEEDLRQECRLANAVIAALFNPEQRTDVNCAEIYDLWKL